MNGPIALGVNIDHVATLRQARRALEPDPVHAALAAEQAGADSITLHLREDRRHIQDRDVRVLRGLLQTHMNLEMAVTEEMIRIAQGVLPQDCCLVPESRQEVTTEGGLDVAGQGARIADAVQALGKSGIRVSLFIDPDLEQIEAAHRAHAPVIELHTGTYSDSTGAARWHVHPTDRPTIRTLPKNRPACSCACGPPSRAADQEPISPQAGAVPGGHRSDPRR